MSTARARIQNRPTPASSPSSANALPPACRLPSSATANRPAISSTSLTWSEHCFGAMAVRPPGSPVFNVCSGVSTSVEALAQVIAQLAGQDLDVQIQPPRAGEIRHSLGVPTLANSVLGIEGRVPLHAGLSKVVAWLTGLTG